mgnify:CR=1 FL=1
MTDVGFPCLVRPSARLLLKQSRPRRREPCLAPATGRASAERPMARAPESGSGLLGVAAAALEKLAFRAGRHREPTPADELETRLRTGIRQADDFTRAALDVLEGASGPTSGTRDQFLQAARNLTGLQAEVQRSCRPNKQRGLALYFLSYYEAFMYVGTAFESFCSGQVQAARSEAGLALAASRNASHHLFRIRPRWWRAVLANPSSAVEEFLRFF